MKFFYNIIHSCKKFKKIILLVILVLNLIFSSCEKRKAYIFSNPDYNFVYKDEYKIYKNIKKKLYRDFFEVNENIFTSFEDIEVKIDNLIDNNQNGLVFLNDGMSSLLLKKVSEKHKKNYVNYKLLTYNLPEKFLYPRYTIPVFNIGFNKELLFSKIENLLSGIEDLSSDFSNCGIYYNQNYSLPSKLADFLFTNKYKVKVMFASSDYKILLNWIKQFKLKTVILFGYKYNSFIINLENEKFKDITFIEIFSNYSQTSGLIKYSINYNWEYAINRAIFSKEFKNFYLNDNKKMVETVKDTTSDSVIINFMIKDDKLVMVKPNMMKEIFEPSEIELKPKKSRKRKKIEDNEKLPVEKKL